MSHDDTPPPNPLSRTAEGRFAAAAFDLKDAADHMAAAHRRGADLQLRLLAGDGDLSEDDARRSVEEIVASVARMRAACDQWSIARAMWHAPPPPLPVGTLVLAVHEGRNVLSRVALPPFANEAGDWLVALEGMDGHQLVPALIVVDDVLAFFGEVAGTGEPINSRDIGEAGCRGCMLLGGALCVLQEAYSRFRAGRGGTVSHPAQHAANDGTDACDDPNID